MRSKNSPFRSRGKLGTLLRNTIHKIRRVDLRIRSRGKVTFGHNFWIATGFDIRCPDYCLIGDRVSIGKNFTLECNLCIGDDVLVSSNVSIVGNDHQFGNPSQTVFTDERNEPPSVILKGDNLLGFGVIVVGPATIGRGCIVGAGAVVTQDLPNYSICVGVPAKPVAKRFPETAL